MKIQVAGMENPHLRRRLTAVLMADVVGYSRLMGVDEEGTHCRLASHIEDLLKPKIAENHGRLIRTAGDGFLVEFDSAVDAVRCGLDIQRELAGHNAGVPTDRRIQLRIGVNAGDVIVDNQEIYGNSVNIAARLEGLAEAGGVCVTRGVRDQLEGQPNLSFEDRGERRVKNIRTPIRVYRVTYREENRKGFWHSLIARRSFSVARRVSTRAILLSTVVLAASITIGMVGLPTWRDQWRLAPRESIVVLPFSNFSGDREQDYFADAVTDDLTTELSRLPGSFVIASATAFAYKGKAVDARQIGQECGVRYLLEGSIQRSGTRVQTNARLIDAASAAQLWADRFENEITDLFDLQDAISGRIAASLNIQLVQVEYRRAIAEPRANADAVDLRLRAMGLYINGITPEHTLAARGLLKDAIRLDPTSAESWAWLADLLASDYLNRWNDAGKDQLQEAEEAVQRALAIDPYNYLAYFANGFIHRARGENAAALDAFNQALKLNHNFARGFVQKANELINAGKPDEAPPLVERAIKLSPRDPSLGVFYWNLGRAYFFADQYRDAVPWLQKAVDLRPNLWHNWLYLASSYVLIGDETAARKVLSDFNNYYLYRDRRFTLATVKELEQANPNVNPIIVAGREKFHEGLLRAGMKEG
jgi:adenylate cyclase